jgi:hypothetical protein
MTEFVSQLSKVMYSNYPASHFLFLLTCEFHHVSDACLSLIWLNSACVLTIEYKLVNHEPNHNRETLPHTHTSAGNMLVPLSVHQLQLRQKCTKCFRHMRMRTPQNAECHINISVLMQPHLNSNLLQITPAFTLA